MRRYMRNKVPCLADGDLAAVVWPGRRSAAGIGTTIRRFPGRTEFGHGGCAGSGDDVG